jgi:membrane-bound serine protease (ClpP class)
LISSLLMSIGVLGILIELYHPGWGIPGTIGVLCLLLFFVGHYVVRLAGWEEIILFAVGLGLLALEIFVIPGFGVAGIAGIVAILSSLFLALVGKDLTISWRFGYVTDALTVMASAVLVIVVGGALAIRFLPRSRAGGFFILGRALEAHEGYTTHATSPAEKHPPGTRGLALGDLRPSGAIRIGGDRIDAVSEGDFIDRGTEVEIVAWRAGQPVVRPVDALAYLTKEDS